MVIMAGGSTTPTASPRDPQEAARQKVRSAFNNGRPEWWAKLNLTPEEEKRVVSLFNQLYGNVSRRPGGYDISKSNAFFADPNLPRVLDSLVQAAAPFKATYGEDMSKPSTGTGIPGRSLGGIARINTAEVPQAYVNKAIDSEGRSAPHMKTIVAAAAKHGVPWQVLWGILRKESNFDARAIGKNKNGSTDSGIAQINSIHKVPQAQAMNPAFAIDWAAAKLKAGHATYGDWSLAVLNYHRPRSASHIFNSGDGSSEPGWGANDRKYVGDVFAGLDTLGFTGDDTTALDGSEGGGGGGGGGPSVLTPKQAMPDPVAIKQKTAEYLRGLFFREPTEQELEGAVGLVSNLVAQTNAQGYQTDLMQIEGRGGGGGSNPFRTPGDELQHPLPGFRKSSSFGPRVHPVHGQQKMHSGTDWAAPEGTDIKAAVSGKVVFAGKKGGYGNIVIVQGADGREYRYAHMSRLGATTGDEVMAGAAIGKVGQTGTATGAHLHFEVRQGGKAIDPETFLAADDDSPAPAPVGAGAITAPAAPTLAPTPTDFDHDARLAEHVKGMPEYKELYGRKPAGVSDQDYAASFAGVGTEMLGSAAPANEAIRAGLATGQASTTAGVIAGDPRSMENKTFRQRLFEASAVFNGML